MFSFSRMTFTTGRSTVVISMDGPGREKTHFGDECVESINVSSSVNLDRTTVSRDVVTDGSITATNATVRGKITAGGSATLTHTTCSGTVDAGGSINSTSSTLNSLSAGGSVTVVSSKVSSAVSAGGSLTAIKCEQLEQVSAGGSAEIDECVVTSSVSAGGDVTLEKSKVTGNVSAGSQARVVNSTIGGTLTCSAERMVIEGSTIDTIELKYAHRASVFSMGGGSFGTAFSSVFLEGSSVISIGGPSTAFGNVIIDGVPLSELMKARAATGAESRPAERGPKQILELRNSTVKNVIFEGGNGEIILSGESALTGAVTGGVVKE